MSAASSKATRSALSFEADRVSVTTPAGWTTSSGTNVSGGHTGRWSWQLTSAATLEQQVPTLPNGTYSGQVRLVNVLLLNAIRKGASDIHVECYEKKLRIRYRIDGVLHE